MRARASFITFVHTLNMYDDLDGRILDTDDTRHDVNNPLRVNDHVIFEKLVVKVLQCAQIVQELNALHRLRVLKDATVDC